MLRIKISEEKKWKHASLKLNLNLIKLSSPIVINNDHAMVTKI